ncbi:MAG: hypothetical protein CME62_15760 [Halobacteriovoraceae bacterium]|nr:hypothetical protein [Halobacteriovoraceae bacterium]|tara:strand:+ start:2445 stop:5507 length:3063 start_codon:yes stop_codon:yes gene_type:complete
MKKLIDYFVDHPMIVNLITLLIVVMGLLSMISLNKEVFPNVDFNFITVRAVYLGAAAEDVEKLVTIEIERELKEVDGIDEINAMSSEGASIVSLKVDPDYDTDDVLIDVRNALNDLESKVPDDVESPVISKVDNQNRALIKVAILGDDDWQIREDAKYVQDELELLPFIASVEIEGYREQAFDVQVDYKKLERYDLTLTQVLNAIRDRQTNITAGNVELKDREKLIRTLVENETVKDLEQVVITSNDVGNAIRVADVAQVTRILKDKTRDERANGKKALILDVQVKSSSDVLKSAEVIKNEIEEISKRKNIDYYNFADLSYYVERRLGVLTQNGVQGIILVLLCLTFFLNFRVSFITALGAPFAFLVAFALMDSFGITINLISMFALILVLGMLVDDAIIVAEQYYQYIEEGMDNHQAAKKAAYDTLTPVSSTVITTMVAFASLFFMEGIMGKFLWAIPAVVIICLLASWLECFIILPSHLADWGKNKAKVERTRWYLPLMNFYEKTIRFSLKHSLSTLLIFISLFGLSIYTATQMRFELFPSDDITYAYLNIKGPVGAPFEETNEILMGLEEIIEGSIAKEELVGYRTITGFQWAKGATPRIGDHYGTIFVELTMQDFRDRSTDEILKTVSEKIKGKTGRYEFSLEKIKNGPPSGKPVNIEISADSLDDLISASESIKNLLDKNEKIISSEIDYEKGKQQIIVKIDEQEARRLGVSNAQIAMELRNAFEGLVATTIKKSEEDVDVLVRLQKSQRASEDILQDIKVMNASGRRIPLHRMASFVEREGAFIIRRFDRRRTFAISAEVDLLKSTSVAVNKEVEPEVKKIVSQYPGMIYRLSGENKDTQDSLASFKKALVGSAFIIFIILVVQFSSMIQPLIIMTAIPFGLIGVVFSFLVFGLSIGFMALMGMLGLVGVVINDSIVLVSFVNRYIEEHGLKIDSLVKACVSRFRPVILTTFTTVAGLLPVAHMPGGDPFLKPMATSFAYGLLFSSTITLVFVPVCYFVYLKGMQRLGKIEAFE